MIAEWLRVMVHKRNTIWAMLPSQEAQFCCRGCSRKGFFGIEGCVRLRMGNEQRRGGGQHLRASQVIDATWTSDKLATPEKPHIRSRQSCLGFSRWSRCTNIKVSRLKTRGPKLAGRKKFRMRLHDRAGAKPTVLRSRHQAQDQRNPSRESRSDSVQPFGRYPTRKKARETRSYSLARAMRAKMGEIAAAAR
jgi:hypothetical protein